MNDGLEQAQEDYKLSEAFHKNFTLPKKRNALGLYEIYHADGKKVFQCKSITKLSEWCYRAEEGLKLYYKQQEEKDESV